MPKTEDRSSALEEIFEKAGLATVLTFQHVGHRPAERRTKLQFEREGSQKLRSIELVDTDDGPYPRVHFLPDVSDRIKRGLQQVPGIRVRRLANGRITSTDHGISYEGGLHEALTVAKHLRRLLSESASPSHAEGPAAETTPRPRQRSGKVASSDHARAKDTSAAPAPRNEPAESILDQLRSLDQEIIAFASSAANRQALWSRTKSYSTPFRGTLFGKAMQIDVARQLAKRPASVLVLGANPNDNGENSPAQRLRYRSLADHVQTGFFGEAVWNDAGIPEPEWNASALARWSVLFNPLRSAGVPEEEVAFANFIPWGSSKLKDLVDLLQPVVLARALGLAESLLVRIVRITRPRLIIVPESISRDLAASSLAKHRAMCSKQIFQYPTRMGPGTFNYYPGEARVSEHQTMMLHLRHPSSLQLTSDGRRKVEAELAAVFRKLL